MRRSLTLGGLLFLFGTSAFADQPERKPWQWTDEERIARRFDPSAIRARFERAAREGLLPNASSTGRQPKTEAAETPQPRNVVIGSHNPELFLAFELFPYLMRDAFIASESNANRERLNPVVSHFAEPKEFWSKFESAVMPYVESARKEAEIAQRLSGAASAEDRAVVLREMEAHQEPQCGIRHAALLAAAASVGQENLHRLLYETVAPHVNTIATEREITPSRLRFVAGGC